LPEDRFGRDAALAGLAFATTAARADWSGDGKPDVLAREPDGTRVVYRRTGSDRVRHKTVSRRFVMCR
jgi:hypothetical protein